MCYQNEAGSYAKQTIRGVPPGAKQPIMAAPACVSSQQEAELALVSSQSPAEWLISRLDWRGDRMLNVHPPLRGRSAWHKPSYLCAFTHKERKNSPIVGLSMGFSRLKWIFLPVLHS